MKEQYEKLLNSVDQERFKRNKQNLNQQPADEIMAKSASGGMNDECFAESKEKSCGKCNLAVQHFCLQCKDVFCLESGIMHQNNSCETMLLDEASERLKKQLKSEIMKVRCLIRYANIVVRDLRSYLEKVAFNLADITEQVFERAKNIPQSAEILVETTINEIQRENDSESNRITAKIKQFENFITIIKSMLIACENVFNESDERILLVKGYTFLQSSANHRKSLPISPLERCIYTLTPVVEKPDGLPLLPEEQLGEFSKSTVPWRIEVKRTESLRPEAVASSRFVTTMCPSKDENVWVVWQWGPRIHLVDKEGNVKQIVDAGVKVDDICLDFDGNLVISSHESKCIKIYNPKHEVIKTIVMDKVPRGIDYTSKNELVVCCVQNLHHRNGDVSLLKRIRTDITDNGQTNIGNDDSLMQPWRIAVNINGDICVSDRNAGNVKVFNSQGVLKAVYNGPDTSTRHPFAPHGIACDNHGQIFVVDYANHTVHVLDPLGRFRGFLIMDTELEKRAIFMGTSSPFSITVDSIGDLWVGNKFGYLTVLKYMF